MSYLVVGELCQKIRIVGESFNLHTNTIHIDTQQLSPIGAEGDLLDTISIDQFQKVRVTDIRWLAVRVLLNDWDITARRNRGGGGHIRHESTRTIALRPVERALWDESTGLVGKYKCREKGGCELHC